MEIITYFFTSKSIRNVFITCMLIFNAHFSFSQVDLRTCNYDCTSNNYTLKDVYLSLSNVNGDPITNTTCTIGEVRQVYIYLNYSSNSNSNIYFARLNSDLTIAGVTTFVNVLLGSIVPGENKKLLYGPFNWTCGDELSLSNTIIAWKTNSNNDPGTNYNCSSYTNSQCDFTNSFVISKPLAVQFTYKACKTSTNTTVKFTSTTNGGIAPYTYAWDFRNDGGIPDSTIANPTFTYTTSNNTAKLTVTDSQNLTNTYIVPIVEPNEIMLSETHTNIGCSGGTTTLTLNVTGGTPGYTYSWNTGAVTKDLANIAPGTYTVTVTDANSCIKTQSFIINQPTSLSATISQTNATCFGGSNGTATVTPSGGTTPYTYVWSPSGGTNATATGLMAGNYSVLVTDANNCTITKNVTIIDGDSIPPVINPLPSASTINCPALPVFAEATATDNTGVVASLTYVDSTTPGNCAGAYTRLRTWTAKDACGNTSLPVSQTIIVQDNTKPTWTTGPNTLNITLQCSDISGLATAQALFPGASDLCDTDVSNILKVSGQFVSSGCANTGTYTNTWTVADDCENISDTFTQVITIQDTTSPSWTTAANALDITLQCSDAPGLATAQANAPVATDNCGGTVSYTKTSGIFSAGSCINSGTYTNTWVAKDVCNNSSTTFTQTITIEDTTAPIWTTAAASLNVTLQCSDISGLATAQAAAPIATNNCGGTVTYTKTSGVFAPASCVNSGTYTNTWVAKDVCNNSSTTFTQTITIEDTTAPIWTTAVASLNVTLQCSDISGLATAQAAAPIATDNCGGMVTYTKTSGVFAPASCVNSGTYTNTWVAKDVCNNSSTTFTQTITIEDTTAPIWTTAVASLNVTLQCSDISGLATAQAAAPIATDNCGGMVTYTKTSGVFAPASCVNSGTYTNTWVAKDVCNNSSTTFTQTITIEDTTAPIWTTAAASLNVTLQCSDISGLATAHANAPIATDNCGGTVTYTKTSGVFAPASCVNSGTYTNTWVAKDVCNNSSTTFTQTITIEDTTAPIWTTAAASLNVTLQCSDVSGLATAQANAPIATDNCDGTVTYTKTSGVFAPASCVNSGTYTNTWVAKDVCNNSSTTFTQTITIEDTTAPIWTTAAASLNVTLQCSDISGLATAQAAAPIATDNCGGMVTYTKTSGVFAPASCVNSGTYTNTWVAKDVCNNSSTTFTQTITIEDTTAPIWTTAAASLNVTLQCSDISGLATAHANAPIATDNCGGTVTYTKTSGVFAPASCVNSGTYTNTWVAKDVCNNSSTTFTQTITIEDTTAPIWTTAAASLNVTLQCSDISGLATAQAAAPIATDNCGGMVTYTKTSGVFAPASCVNSGTYTNTWVAKDVCNNSSTTFTQTITIEDTTAPIWTTAVASLNVTLQCSDISGLATAQAAAPIATDNCGGMVTYTKTSGVFAPASCVNSGTYTNTWVAKDVCNNSSTTFTQTITIEDTTAPIWTTAAASLNVTLQCSDISGLATAHANAPIATDNCGGMVTYTKTSGVFAPASCVNSGTYTNTWVAKDVCNNSSTTFTQTITIEDTTAPIWTTAVGSLNVTLQCSDISGLATAQANAPIATDNCDGTVTYTKTSGELQKGNCGSTGTYTNTWIAVDICQNTSTIFTQVITIQDNTAPTWITQAGTLNLTLQCSDTAGLAAAQNQVPTATANCSIVTYIKTSGEFAASQGCANAGTYTNSWIAKDDCGNTSDSFIQIITIEDSTAPTWTTETASLNVTLQCSDLSGLANAQAMFPTASDLCDADVLNIVKISGQFIASEGCSNAGTYTNTWTVKDDCGNTSDIFTQVITIEDTTAPTWTTEMASLNVTLQCSDLSGLALAQTLFPTASDLCDADVLNIVKVSGQFIASEGCSNAGTYTNTWTVKDDCGNTSDTFTQVITIEDTTAPTWTTEMAYLNVTLQCSDLSGLALAQTLFPTASDLCDADVLNIVKVSGQFMASEGCSNAGTYTNTWTVKDDCGNISDIFTQVITIEDTTAPTWTTEMAYLNVTLQCSDLSGLALAQTLFPTASDLCDADVLNIVKVSGQFMASEGCSNAGTYTNTWTVKDDCGNISDTFTQVITIEDTTAPTWTTETASLNVTLQCSDLSGLENAQAMFPVASDLCDADVLNIVKISGQFMASEGCSNAGTYTNIWSVKDDCGNTSDTFTQVITIEDTTAPTWTTETASLNVTLQCSDLSGLANAQAMFPVASDFCDADVLNIVKISGQFIASEGCSNAGTYTNTWTVKDDCGNTSDTFTQVITIEDTTAPTWTTETASLNVTLQCSDLSGLENAQAMFPVASDLCDADVLNIVKISGQFMASEGCSNAGTYTNIWSVKDDCGNTSDTFTQVITIEDTTAPTWTTETASLNVTLQCSDLSGLANAQAMFPVASDLCDADVLNIVKVSGQFMASEGCSNAGTYTNTWTVKDDCGNISDIFTQVITIEDTTAPTWTTEMAYLNVTLQCSDLSGLALAQTLFPTASDLCDADVLNIVKVSGQFMASEGCSNAGTYTNTWTVKDDCGNTSDTFTQVITLEDTTPPMFTGTLPIDITVSCDAVPEPAVMQASDNCNGDLPIVFSEVKTSLENECATNYTLTRTWSTNDCNGNSVSHFQIITVRDTTPPTGTAPADVTDLQNVAAIPTGSPQDVINASDNCSESVNISISDSNNGGSGCEGNAFILTRTYTLTDCAGNKTELIQRFTVENKISVMGTASNVTCFEGNNGSILVTNSPGSVVVVTNENNEVVGNTGLRAGVYTLTATSAVNNNNQVCSATATVTITQPSNVIITLNGDACNADSSPINLSGLLLENISTTGIWTDTNGTNALQGSILNVFGLALGNYTFEYKTTNEDCPKSVSLNLLVNDDCRVLACENVLVHNAFSPNGDGINDFFKIDNIDLTTCYPENTVEIYNRWGILVFETTNYNNITNAFDGTSRGRATIKQSEGLPTGTYFYIINYKSLDGNNKLQSNKKDGFLYLSK